MKGLKLAIAAVMVLLTPAYLVVANTYHLAQSDASLDAGSDEVTVAFAVRNPGLFEVEVKDADISNHSYFVRQSISMIENPGTGVVPFHTVTLEPDEQLLLWLTFRVSVPSGIEPCIGFGLSGLWISYSVLDTERVESVDLPRWAGFKTACESS